MFKNMKIGVRLALSFSIMLVLIVVLIGGGINSMSKIDQNLDEIVNVENVRTELANNMVDGVREVSIAIRTILLDKNKVTFEEQKNRISDFRKSYNDDLIKYEAVVTKDETKIVEQISKIKRVKDETTVFNNVIINLVSEGKYDAGLEELLKNAKPKVSEMITDIDDLINLEAESTSEQYQIAQTVYANVRFFMFILGGIAVILTIIIALVLTQSITKPLKLATDLVLTRDLSVDLSEYEKGGGELGMMIQSFSKDISERMKLEKELITYRDQLEDMVKQRTEELSNVLTEVKETINILASSSTEILAATTQVATGTAETATAISETSATVEEVQQASKQSSQKAKNVADSAQRVVQVFQNGQKAVEETITGMNKIREQMDSIAQTVVRLSEQSQSIGGIIASVTDIADQSNLLAVNAAIEAAKAGDQGKGFAVVAHEIKNLAGQSKQATLQVRNILNDIQKVTGAAVMATEQGSKAVESGLKQSMQAGDAIRILAESSNEAVQAATQIVASSQQQVVGMDQIGVAMQNINQAGTETAVSMVQAEKSAKSLYELGQKLKAMIEKFQG
jgi:methyl-accepting chemotaxis protein